jgi:hypothetical protein
MKGPYLIIMRSDLYRRKNWAFKAVIFGLGTEDDDFGEAGEAGDEGDDGEDEGGDDASLAGQSELRR